MTALATLYALASIIAAPIALAFLASGGRADDLSRTRNNAAGEKGEGEKIRFNHHGGSQ